MDYLASMMGTDAATVAIFVAMIALVIVLAILSLYARIDQWPMFFILAGLVGLFTVFGWMPLWIPLFIVFVCIAVMVFSGELGVGR